VIIHMIIVMSKHEPTPEFPPYLRRRVVFELTLEELPLLEEAEREHGSKRGALVRALEGLRASRELAARLEAAEVERARLEDELAAERKQRETTEKQQKKLAGDLKKAKQSSSQARSSVSDESRRGDELERILADRDHEVSALEREIDELESQLLHELFCARCGEWVATADWGWKKATSGGRYAYHHRCGDHGPGLVSPSSWLGWQAR
jgi:hypothetical protein